MRDRLLAERGANWPHVDRLINGPCGSLSRVALPAETRLTDELLNLHRGQGLDLFWRDSLQCPTEEEYVDMVNGSASFRQPLLLFSS